jgi:hypothetical protein
MKARPAALILASIVCACAVSPGNEAQRIETAADRLSGAGDAGSLAAAAVLRVTDSAEAALSLIEKAAALEPERADLAWLHAQLCVPVRTCDQAAVEERLRTVDPQNAAGWLGGISRVAPSQRVHEPELDASLEAFGRASRFDLYWNGLTYRLTTATARTGVFPLGDTLMLVIGRLGSADIPAFQGLSFACRTERLGTVKRIELCRAVANVLRRGDTLIAQSMGLSIAERLWPAESTEGREIREARRTHRYRMQLAQSLDSNLRFTRRDARKYLEAFAKHRTEQELYLARIVEAGKNPDPPPDWVDSSAQ